jgi:hypothetical protein
MFNSTMDAVTTAFDDDVTLLTTATSWDEAESSDTGVAAKQITTTGNTGSPLDNVSQAICNLANVCFPCLFLFFFLLLCTKYIYMQYRVPSLWVFSHPAWVMPPSKPFPWETLYRVS